VKLTRGPAARLIVALALATSSMLMATTVIPMSVEDLTSAASDVVEARATQSWSQWDAQHTRISTYTRFQVTRRLKGSAPLAVVVRQMGGSAGGYTQKVAGVRYWRAGEDSVLFLRPSVEESGMMAVVGLMQGNFKIVRSATGEIRATNGISGVSTWNAASKTIGTYSGTGMSLAELEKRVRQAAK
jgi:hypothetical protein